MVSTDVTGIKLFADGLYQVASPFSDPDMDLFVIMLLIMRFVSQF